MAVLSSNIGGVDDAAAVLFPLWVPECDMHPFRAHDCAGTIVAEGTCRSPAYSRRTRLAIAMSFMEGF